MAAATTNRSKKTQTKSTKKAKASKEVISVTFAFRNSTKGAHRYQEVDKNGAEVDQQKATVGSLYFRKSAVGDESPGDKIFFEATFS